MGRRWTDWWRRLKVGGLQAKCQTLYLQVFVTFLYIFFLLRKCKLLGQSRRKLARNRRVTRNASESKNIFKNDRSITYPRTPPFANNIGHSESGQSQSQANQQVSKQTQHSTLGFPNLRRVVVLLGGGDSLRHLRGGEEWHRLLHGEHWTTLVAKIWETFDSHRAFARKSPRQGSQNFEHFLLTNIKTRSDNPFPHSGIRRKRY